MNILCRRTVVVGGSGFLSLTPLPTPIQSPEGSDHQVTTSSSQIPGGEEKELTATPSPTLKPPLRRRGKSKPCQNVPPKVDMNNLQSEKKTRNLLKTCQLMETQKERPLLVLTMPSMCDEQDVDNVTEVTKSQD